MCSLWAIRQCWLHFLCKYSTIWRLPGMSNKTSDILTKAGMVEKQGTSLIWHFRELLSRCITSNLYHSKHDMIVWLINLHEHGYQVTKRYTYSYIKIILSIYDTKQNDQPIRLDQRWLWYPFYWRRLVRTSELVLPRLNRQNGMATPQTAPNFLNF